MEKNKSESVLKRRNKSITEKLSISQLLNDSYKGGEAYLKGGHLVKYIRESSKAYDARLKRSVYFNHLQPLVDLIVGFIFTNPPGRDGNTKDFSEIIDNSYKGKDLNTFMYKVATKSSMITCGVLVDSPKFDPDEIVTEQDRIDAEIKPYCLLYPIERIRDFNCDNKGKLTWILLDNSYTDSSDPYKPAKEVTVYRLWTREYYRDITFDNEGTETVENKGDKIAHDLEEVPFIFTSWRDPDDDKVSDTIFEDIALYDRAIYNFMSCMDEMITGGSFKILFVPVEDIEDDIPEDVKSGGMANLSVFPFKGDLSNPPFFAGAGLEEITPFIGAIELYLSEILKKVGVESAEEQSIVKTGVARKYDFQKTKAYIVSGIKMLEDIEKEIFRLDAKWRGKDNVKLPKVTYYRDFLEEDLDQKITRYIRLLILPYEDLKKEIHKLIVKSALSNDIKREQLEKILKEIDSYEDDGEGFNNKINDLIDKAKGDQNLNKGQDDDDKTITE